MSSGLRVHTLACPAVSVSTWLRVRAAAPGIQPEALGDGVTVIGVRGVDMGPAAPYPCP